MFRWYLNHDIDFIKEVIAVRLKISQDWAFQPVPTLLLRPLFGLGIQRHVTEYLNEIHVETGNSPVTRKAKWCCILRSLLYFKMNRLLHGSEPHEGLDIPRIH